MASDYEVKQAIGIVARLGGFAIKRVATTDDLKERTLTISLTRVSDGWHQDSLSFEDIPAQLATVDGNSHVESISTLQPGDLSETEAEANAEIAAAAEDPDGWKETAAEAINKEIDAEAAESVATDVQQGEIDGVATTITKFEPIGKKRR